VVAFAFGQAKTVKGVRASGACLKLRASDSVIPASSVADCAGPASERKQRNAERWG
jgi:hypothetical protein